MSKFFRNLFRCIVAARSRNAGLPSGRDVHEYYDYGRRNDYRMRAYHRLDLSIAFIKKKRWGERRWIVGFYNAYSRKNPFYVDVEADFYGNLSYKQYSLFPIIPSVSYQFKF